MASKRENKKLKQMDSTLLREQKAEANGLILLMNTFDFALTLHLMKKVLGISHELSQTLQRKDQDIVNAMQLVKITKQRYKLICMACLSPTNLFSSFDTAKLVEFAKFYPQEFCNTSLPKLDNQLETYIVDMRMSIEFASLKGIGDLSEMLVKTGKHIVYPLVYRLLKLAMILPVATVTVERSFSAMKIVKSRLRNRMGMNG